MGICGSRSLTAEERAAAEKSKKIDASNEQDFHQEDGSLFFCIYSFVVFLNSQRNTSNR